MSSRRQAKGRRRYFSDADDAQWAVLRGGVFQDHPRPDSLRPVVNALVFRDRALCPWELLPPDFPPVDVLQAYLEQWQSDGTWETIVEVVSTDLEDERLPRWPRLNQARRAVARWLKQVPGGTLLLLPGRTAIQILQYVMSRFTPEARLPGRYLRAYRLLRAKDYPAAAELFSRILEIDPVNVSARLERVSAYLEIGRHEDAIADARRILSCPDVTVGQIARVYSDLSRAYALIGDGGRSVRHRYQCKLLQLYGAEAPWDREAGGDPDELEMLAESHNEMAEYLINVKGDFATAVELYRGREAVRARYAGWLRSAPLRTLHLPDDWVRLIGHIALVDVWVKLLRMGWVDYDRLVLLAPTAATANPYYLAYYKPLLQIKETPRFGAMARHLAATLGPRVANALTLPDGTCEYFCEAQGVIQEAWEAQGGKPLLRLTEHDRAFGEKQLRALGVPKGAWFVALHVRSGGFHNEGQNIHQAHRNAGIETYLPAIQEVVRRGGWVVRMGDRSMPRLPEMPGVIDYAYSPAKSARMDVFLCGAARFYIGVTSGLCHVPSTFGVPVLTTNWISNVPLGVYNGGDLTLPKLLRSGPRGRLLPFQKRLTRPVTGWCQSGDALREHGLEVVDNTPDEIRDAAAEMLDRLDGTYRETPADLQLHARFQEALKEAGIRGSARIGTAFLRAHADLLPARTSVAA